MRGFTNDNDATPRKNWLNAGKLSMYESGIRVQIEAGNEGKIVAIDIETGEFEVGDTVMAATRQLFKRHPDAQPWGTRIGHRAVYHFGSRSWNGNARRLSMAS